MDIHIQPDLNLLKSMGQNPIRFGFSQFIPRSTGNLSRYIYNKRKKEHFASYSSDEEEFVFPHHQVRERPLAVHWSSREGVRTQPARGNADRESLESALLPQLDPYSGQQCCTLNFANFIKVQRRKGSRQLHHCS